MLLCNAPAMPRHARLPLLPNATRVERITAAAPELQEQLRATEARAAAAQAAGGDVAGGATAAFFEGQVRAAQTGSPCRIHC